MRFTCWQLLELWVRARGLLLLEQPHADEEVAILDPPVADQVFETLQTLNPCRRTHRYPGVAMAVPIGGKSVYGSA